MSVVVNGLIQCPSCSQTVPTQFFWRGDQIDSNGMKFPKTEYMRKVFQQRGVPMLCEGCVKGKPKEPEEPKPVLYDATGEVL